MAPRLGEDDGLVGDRPPGAIIEAELNNVDGSLPLAVHITSQPALLHRIQEHVKAALLHHHHHHPRDQSMSDQSVPDRKP